MYLHSTSLRLYNYIPTRGSPRNVGRREAVSAGLSRVCTRVTTRLWLRAYLHIYMLERICERNEFANSSTSLQTRFFQNEFANGDEFANSFVGVRTSLVPQRICKLVNEFANSYPVYNDFANSGTSLQTRRVCKLVQAFLNTEFANPFRSVNEIAETYLSNHVQAVSRI